MADRKSIKQELSGKSASKAKPRPPIVAVLGHVDHGKTAILDFIRKTRVAEKEAGGITQSVGAYQVEVEGGKITFIDTPGHEAFVKMRARGGFVSDLVVLVIAADDGVMPQTKESLEHIRAAKVPFLVAVNKIDLPQANQERVYDQLEKEKVLVEGRGGKIVVVSCSAKTGQGVKDLLEMILLLAEMNEIKADPGGPLEAVVIESRKTKAGSQTNILVKNGTLKVGDFVEAEGYQAKVRSLIDEWDRRIKEASPSQPVSVLGFSQIPPVGAKVSRVETLVSKDDLPATTSRTWPQEEEGGKFKIILKADSLGLLEAICGSLPEEIFLIKSEVGEVTESDIMLAQTTQAEIFTFQVKTPPRIEKLAESEKVKIRSHQIIYKLLEELEEARLRKEEDIKDIKEEEVLGKAEVVAEFPYGEARIAGCRVIQGRIAKNDKISLVRGEEVLGQLKISSMKYLDKDIKLARQGSEFGAVFTPHLDFRTGDMLISKR